MRLESSFCGPSQPHQPTQLVFGFVTRGADTLTPQKHKFFAARCGGGEGK